MDPNSRSVLRICVFGFLLACSGLIEARLTLPSEYEGGTGFGTSVAVSLNDELAISAPDTRAIFIYKQGENTTWSVSQVISLDQGSEADQFGASILFGNNFLFIGAPGVLNNAGELYVYSKIKTDKWEFIQKINPLPTGSRTNRFGLSISVSEKFLVVGSQPKAYIFKLNETSTTWRYLQTLDPAGVSGSSTVLITNDYLFVGFARSQKLAYYVYYYDEFTQLEGFAAYQWLELPYQSNRDFGSGLAIFGNNVIIAAPNVTINGSDISQIRVVAVNETTGSLNLLEIFAKTVGVGKIMSTSIDGQKLFLASNYSASILFNGSGPDTASNFNISGVTSMDGDSKNFVFFGTTAGAVAIYQYVPESGSWLEIDGNAPIQAPTDSPKGTDPNLALGLGLGLSLAAVAAGVAIFLVLFMKKKKQKKKKAEEQRAEQARQRAASALPRVQSQYNALPAINNSESDPTQKSLNAEKAMTETLALDRLNVPYASLKFNEEIGVGAFGKVFLGEWEHAVVALKIGTVISNKDFFEEAKLMVELRPHPNIVQMYGVSVDGPYPVMILEYCDGGSLDKRLFTPNSSLGHKDELDFAFGIAKGLNYLHKNGIVHRDLAVRNVLLLHGVPKISDFGMSRLVGPGAQGTTKSNVGPIRWMAPESLKSKEYSHFSDVWSYGITLYEIVARQEPHRNEDELNIAVKIRDSNFTPTIPETCNPFLKGLMERCWHSDPTQRPTMDAICNEFQEYLTSASSQA